MPDYRAYEALKRRILVAVALMGTSSRTQASMAKTLVVAIITNTNPTSKPNTHATTNSSSSLLRAP